MEGASLTGDWSPLFILITCTAQAKAAWASMLPHPCASSWPEETHHRVISVSTAPLGLPLSPTTSLIVTLVIVTTCLLGIERGLQAPFIWPLNIHQTMQCNHNTPISKPLTKADQPHYPQTGGNETKRLSDLLTKLHSPCWQVVLLMSTGSLTLAFIHAMHPTMSKWYRIPRSSDTQSCL